MVWYGMVSTAYDLLDVKNHMSSQKKTFAASFMRNYDYRCAPLDLLPHVPCPICEPLNDIIPPRSH